VNYWRHHPIPQRRTVLPPQQTPNTPIRTGFFELQAALAAQAPLPRVQDQVEGIASVTINRGEAPVEVGREIEMLEIPMLGREHRRLRDGQALVFDVQGIIESHLHLPQLATTTIVPPQQMTSTGFLSNLKVKTCGRSNTNPTADEVTQRQQLQAQREQRSSQYKKLASAFYTLYSKYRISLECAKLLIDLAGRGDGGASTTASWGVASAPPGPTCARSCCASFDCAETVLECFVTSLQQQQGSPIGNFRAQQLVRLSNVDETEYPHSPVLPTTTTTVSRPSSRV